MGAMYWMTNSIWPAPSKASLEFGGRWKILHYYSKNFFNDVLVSSFEEPANTYHVHLTSDLNQKLSGTVTITAWTWAGTKSTTWNVPFNLGPLESKEIYTNSTTNMLQSLKREQCLFVLEAKDATSKLLSSNVFYLTSLAQVALSKSKITFQSYSQNGNNQVTFQVVSDKVSPYTFLETTLCGHFSDNAFLLLPNIPTTFSFMGCGNVTVSQLQGSILTHTIRDTYE